MFNYETNLPWCKVKILDRHCQKESLRSSPNHEDFFLQESCSYQEAAKIHLVEIFAA